MAMRVNISIPDDLATEFLAARQHFNVSAVCAEALRQKIRSLGGQSAYFDAIAAAVGVEAVVFDWEQVLTNGIPQLDDYASGLYALEDHRPLYLGRAEDLMRRMGQLVGAALGGWGLHSGGWRLYQNIRKTHVNLDQVKFAMFPGAAVDLERDLITRFNPLLNVSGLRDVSSEVLFSWKRMAPAFTESGVDVAVAGALLDAVVKSVRRVPHTLDDWEQDGWVGAGRSLDRRGHHTLYIGVRERKVGIFAYEGDSMWFGTRRADHEQPARNVAELQALVARFASRWCEEDESSAPDDLA